MQWIQGTLGSWWGWEWWAGVFTVHLIFSFTLEAGERVGGTCHVHHDRSIEQGSEWIMSPKTWHFTRMFQAGWISSCKTRISVA